MELPTSGSAKERSYLLMTMLSRPRLPWLMTLLMPFRATILAFMMGSEMESKSAAHTQSFSQQLDSKTAAAAAAPQPGRRLTQIEDSGLRGGLVSDQGLHLFLLPLLLALLVEEVLQQERLLLQEQRFALVLVLALLLFLALALVLSRHFPLKGLRIGVEQLEGQRARAGVKGDTLRNGAEPRRRRLQSEVSQPGSGSGRALLEAALRTWRGTKDAVNPVCDS